MEEKRLESDNKERVEPLAEESDGKIESDEVLSGSESAEMTEEKTDSSDRGIGTDDKLSPMPSESTSGVVTKSDSSDRGTGTDDKLSPMPSESTSGVVTKSESLRSPGPAEAAIMDEEASPVSPAEAAVGGLVEPAVSQEGAVGGAVVPAVSQEGAVGGAVEPTTSQEGAVGGAVEQSSPDILAEKPEVGSAMSPPEKSKKRGSLVRGAMALFKKSPHKKESSPTEKTGVLSRFRMSRSVSSPEKPQDISTEKSRTLEREKGCATPDDEEAFKKGAEKKPVLKRLAKSISSVFKHKSGSGGETEGLVSDQDDPVRTPVAGSPVKASDQITPEEEEKIVKMIYWTEGRQSLTERPSLTTEMTDLPSTFTGADAVKPGDSGRASEVGENTSEEAVAGSLASSLGDIKEIASDKDEKSVSSTSADKEGESNVAELECKESADDPTVHKNLESEETPKEGADVVTDKKVASQENAEALEEEKTSEKPEPTQEDGTAETKDVEASELKETEPEKPADADKTE